MNTPTPPPDDESLPGTRQGARPDVITAGNASYWHYQPRSGKQSINEDPHRTLHVVDAPLEPSGAPFRVACKMLADGSVSHCLLGRALIRATQIQSIGIDDFGQVETQHSNMAYGSVSHCIRFHGGGEFCVTYAEKGELLELVASNVIMIITRDNRFIFKPLNQD